MKWWNVRGTWVSFAFLFLCLGYSSSAIAESFVSSWDTTQISEGSSAKNQITLPLEPSGPYNFVVDWGDGQRNLITQGSSPQKTHTYYTPGIYTVRISGAINGFRFNNLGDKLKILKILNFGPLNLGNSGFYFYGAKNLTITAPDPLNLRGTTNLAGAFMSCTSLTTAPSMRFWDTSAVTSMSVSHQA